MATNKLYELFGKHIPDAGYAKDPEFTKNGRDYLDGRYYLPEGKKVTDWKPLQCQTFDGFGFLDYQSCSHCFRFCSQKLKDILENGKGSEDKIQWLDATLTWNGETRPYYVLHFYEDVDVFDTPLSEWDSAREPVFIERKLINHNVLTFPKSGIGLFVKPEIVKEIRKQKLTGMVFEAADVRDL